MENIGDRIKELRKNLGLSLRDLAERIGTTASYMSQVENNKTSPSLTVLKQICDALNTKVSYVLGESTEEVPLPNYFVVKKSERKTIKNFGVGLKLQFLSTFDKNNVIEPTIHIIEPNVISGTPPYEHEGQEFIMVLKGKIKLNLGDKEIVLDEGDSCYFDSVIKHSFENILESGECQILCVSSPGYF